MIGAWVRKASFVLLGLLVGVAIVGVGVFVYQTYFGLDPQTPVTETVFNPEVSVDRMVGNQPNDSVQPDLGIGELDLEELLYQSHFSRAAAIHNHLSNADVDYVARFLQQSQNVSPSSMRREIQEAAIRRLAQLDPQKAMTEVTEMASSIRNSLTSVVFQEWSVNDLDGAIDHASGLYEEYQRPALDGILLSRTDLSESFLHGVARQLRSEQSMADRRTLSLAEEDIDDPLTAWNEFLSEYGRDVESLNMAQQALFSHILDSWVEHGSTEVVARAISSSLVGDGSTDSAVQMLLETWVKTDPSIAFSATMGIESDEKRRQMQEAVIAAWVDVDPLAVLDSIQSIPKEIQDWSKQEALVALSATSPSEAAKRLSTIVDDKTKGSTARSIASNWAKLDPDSARDWVHSDPKVQDMQWALMYRVVLEVSQVDAEKAFKWALEEPVNEQQRGWGLELWVVNDLASRGEYEVAIKLAAQARDIENQQWSYVWIGNELAMKGKSDAAWSLWGEIPERFRSTYESQVANNWVQAEPDAAMERLESLPSQGLKRTLAEALFSEHQMSHLFTKEQVRSLKKYLPEWYQRDIE